MARSDPDISVSLSLLDRLIDREPSLAADSFQTRAQSVRSLKVSLRRDLEWLLNSRRVAEPLPDGFEELPKSLYYYGLPDFTGYSLSSPRDRSRLLRFLEIAIANFEPRLANVKVTPVEVAGVNTRALRFQIEGLLLMDPAPEHVSFDTVLQLTSGEYQVKGDRTGA